MAVADDGHRHGPERVDVEAAGAAVETLGADLQPGLGVGGGHGAGGGNLDILDILRISSQAGTVRSIMQVQVSRWGNSLGVRLPKELAQRLGIGEGSRVDVSEDGGRIVISVERPVYTLDELLVGMTPEAMHEAFDWGEDVGRERVE
jgi:antitoxin MazE